MSKDLEPPSQFSAGAGSPEPLAHKDADANPVWSGATSCADANAAAAAKPVGEAGAAASEAVCEALSFPHRQIGNKSTTNEQQLNNKPAARHVDNKSITNKQQIDHKSAKDLPNNQFDSKSTTNNQHFDVKSITNVQANPQQTCRTTNRQQIYNKRAATPQQICGAVALRQKSTTNLNKRAAHPSQTCRTTNRQQIYNNKSTVNLQQQISALAALL